jgi:hypothetical protein
VSPIKYQRVELALHEAAVAYEREKSYREQGNLGECKAELLRAAERYGQYVREEAR